MARNDEFGLAEMTVAQLRTELVRLNSQEQKYCEAFTNKPGDSLSQQYLSPERASFLSDLSRKIDAVKLELVRRDQPLERRAKRGKAKIHAESAKAQPGTRWYDSSRDVVQRRQIVLKNPNFSAKSLCKVFDQSDIPLPERWFEEFHVTKWADAYERPKSRARIQRIISTDRKEA
jgi:hypothetical protein